MLKQQLVTDAAEHEALKQQAVLAAQEQAAVAAAAATEQLAAVATTEQESLQHQLVTLNAELLEAQVGRDKWVAYEASLSADQQKITDDVESARMQGSLEFEVLTASVDQCMQQMNDLEPMILQVNNNMSTTGHTISQLQHNLDNAQGEVKQSIQESQKRGSRDARKTVSMQLMWRALLRLRSSKIRIYEVLLQWQLSFERDVSFETQKLLGHKMLTDGVVTNVGMDVGQAAAVSALLQASRFLAQWNFAATARAIFTWHTQSSSSVAAQLSMKLDLDFNSHCETQEQRAKLGRQFECDLSKALGLHMADIQVCFLLVLRLSNHCLCVSLTRICMCHSVSLAASACVPVSVSHLQIKGTQDKDLFSCSFSDSLSPSACLR